MKILFYRLGEVDVKLKKMQIQFLEANVLYLVHLVLGQGIEPLHEKIGKCKGNTSIEIQKRLSNFWISMILQKIYPLLCWHSKALKILTKKYIIFK